MNDKNLKSTKKTSDSKRFFRSGHALAPLRRGRILDLHFIALYQNMLVHPLSSRPTLEATLWRLAFETRTVASGTGGFEAVAQVQPVAVDQSPFRVMNQGMHVVGDHVFNIVIDAPCVSSTTTAIVAVRGIV